MPVAVRKAHKKGQEAPHSTEVKGSGTTGALAPREAPLINSRHTILY